MDGGHECVFCPLSEKGWENLGKSTSKEILAWPSRMQMLFIKSTFDSGIVRLAVFHYSNLRSLNKLERFIFINLGFAHCTCKCSNKHNAL